MASALIIFGGKLEMIQLMKKEFFLIRRLIYSNLKGGIGL